MVVVQGFYEQPVLRFEIQCPQAQSYPFNVYHEPLFEVERKFFFLCFFLLRGNGLSASGNALRSVLQMAA